jgi:glycerophosphoryl diester phosphodiesterase
VETGSAAADGEGRASAVTASRIGAEWRMLERPSAREAGMSRRSAARPARPLVIAHRGASAYHPENTVPAYELAVAQAADMIEVDLHRTKDGAVVIAHDAELERIGGHGEIGDATLADVRRLDAGGGARVPTLDELLDGFGSRIALNLELKQGGRGAYAGLPAAALAGVRARGLGPSTLFSSFYDPVLDELRRLDAEARIALLLSRRAPHDWVARAHRLGAEAVNPELPLVDAAFVERAHGEGLAVYVFTVDPREEMERLLALGVDGLFTNVPDRMRGLLGG